jgi:c-di-GMP-binding flagellar brake protein YcgR
MERRKGKVKQVSKSELESRLAAGRGDDDRRSNERVAASLQVEVPLANWDEVRSVYTSNISNGGLLFTLASPASMPATVDLQVTLPDGNKVTLHAEVRHVARREGSAEFDVGVQFQALDAATRRAFEEGLKKLPGHQS